METKNSIYITGTLVDISGIREGTIQNGRNAGHQYIGGSVVMKCMLDGKENRIPVDFFTTDVTMEGSHSKLFDSYHDLKTKVGTRITWANAAFDEHRYVGRDGAVVSTQRIKGRFYNAARSEAADEANFTLDGAFVARGLEEKKNKQGEVYQQELMLGQENYNGTSASLFKFNVELDAEEKIRSIRTAYAPGDTVSVSGKIRYITESNTVTVDPKEDNLFGEPEVKTYTNTYAYYFIEHARKPLAKTDPDAYTLDDIAAYKEARSSADAKLLAAFKSHGNAAEDIAPDAPISNKAASLL